jgi:hypothetical protein
MLSQMVDILVLQKVSDRVHRIANVQPGLEMTRLSPMSKKRQTGQATSQFLKLLPGERVFIKNLVARRLTVGNDSAGCQSWRYRMQACSTIQSSSLARVGRGNHSGSG